MKKFVYSFIFLILFIATGHAQLSLVDIGASSLVNPLTLPSTPVAVYSSIRYTPYLGPWGRVLCSPAATQTDVAFVNNVPDYATAITFCGVNTPTVIKVYDQSGNGNDLIQNTAANQPSFSTVALVNGAMPVIVDGVFVSSTKSMVIPTSLSLPRDNFSQFMAVRQVISYQAQNFFEFTNAGAADFSEFLFNGVPFDTGVDINNGSFVLSGVRPRGQMTTIGIRSSAGASTFSINGTVSTQAPAAALTMNHGGQVGTSIAGAIYNMQGDIFALVFYASALSDPNAALVLSAFNTAFSIPQTFTTRLTYGGSSLISSIGSTLNQNVIRKESLSTKVEIYNFGNSAGQTLTQECSGDPNAAELGMYDGTKARNIFVIDAASSDIANHAAFANSAAAIAFANTLYTTVTVPCVSTRLATGATARVVVPTIISRAGFDTTTNFYEDARVQYNLNVVAGAAANSYSVADRAANTNIGCALCYFDPTYFYFDGIHLNDNGYTVMGGIDGPIINSLVQ